jgi:hypothetical protein
MTGAIYIGLCKHIKTRHPIDTLERRPATVRFRYLRIRINSDADAPPVWCSILGDLSHLGAAVTTNRFDRTSKQIVQMSMFTMDLEQPTSGELRRSRHTPGLYVPRGGYRSSVSTRDIIRRKWDDGRFRTNGQL